jgi:tetratricopeptide (TPR) repeat protein
MLSAEPRSTDALLGLAAVAVRQGNSAEATRLYLQILELEPRHALAQGGLIALLGRADPAAAETRLKQLIARDPSAYLYFTLGNLYADQSQWAQAQFAYFRAHHLEPANPDYAYNLAVGLEHVSQPKLALDFYRRAAQLAAAKGRANFNPAQVQQRIGKLAAQVE